MARWHKRVDANQNDVIKELTARGVKVFDTHEVGEGFPDLVTLWPGQTVLQMPGSRLRIFTGAIVLVEVKNLGGNLDPGQSKFRDAMGPFAPFLVMRTGREEP